MNAAILLALSTLVAPPGRAVDFDTEIIPVLTKAGCNAGACHGAAAGRGDFRLSLLGGDPGADQAAIVQDLEGRRINLAKPGSSLLLAKPTGLLDHGGQQVLELEEPGAQRLLQWIAAGAIRSPTRHLTSFEVAPAAALVDSIGAVVPLRADAQFNDGTTENVTAWTVFTSADPGAVEIDSSGIQAVVRRRGQHVVIARFLDRVVPIQLTLPLGEVPIERDEVTTDNMIDEEVSQVLATLRVPASGPVDDTGFLRRATLDLTGRLPDGAEIGKFLEDRSADKRARLVNRLLEGEPYVEYWTFRIARWLRMRSPANEPEAYAAYHSWLTEQVRADAPWDEFARQLLLATGDSHQVGPANFARTASDARGQAELVSSVFLGVRLQCANCHNHPLDRWTQDDYHGLAAVFARLDRGRTVRRLPRGAVTNPRTNEPAIPRIPGETDVEDSTQAPRALAAWLTSPANPYFARAIVNRLWQAMFGRGLVEPIDDLRATNPATHSELLDRLADDFVAHGFRLRHTLRRIALSDTYQRAGATTANAVDDRFYSHAPKRPLPTEVLVDAIADVIGVPGEFAGERAIAIPPGAAAPSLIALGACDPSATCGITGLATRLHLLNGELINAKLSANAGALQRRIGAGASNEEIVHEFYLRALGRAPNTDEDAYWQAELGRLEERDRFAALQDFLWGLLNSREFTTNH